MTVGTGRFAEPAILLLGLVNFAGALFMMHALNKAGPFRFEKYASNGHAIFFSSRARLSSTSYAS